MEIAGALARFVTVVRRLLPVVKDVCATPLGGRNRSRVAGTPLPICTVTVMVWGASMALGSFTVTMPVYLPRASDAVFRAIFTGTQVVRVRVQRRGGATVA